MTSERKTGSAESLEPVTAAPTLNEWGIPNWRDRSAYGDVKGWSNNRWRWEFFRRRKDLRQCFDQGIRRTEQYYARNAGARGLPDTPLNRTDLYFTVALNEEQRNRFGYKWLVNPRIGNQPEELIRPVMFDAIEGDGMVKMPARHTLEDVLRMANIRLTEEQRQGVIWPPDQALLSIEADEVVIAFNLERPLVPQIDNSKAWLQEIYAEQRRPVRRTRYEQKWLGYLRTLDAHEAGASWSDIAAIHPRTAGKPQTARDIWQAAEALRFKF